MCVWAAPGMPRMYLLPTFGQDIDIQSFLEIVFQYWRGPMRKQVENKKNGLTIIFNDYFLDHYKYFKESFAELLCDLKCLNSIFTL